MDKRHCRVVCGVVRFATAPFALIQMIRMQRGCPPSATPPFGGGRIGRGWAVRVFGAAARVHLCSLMRLAMRAMVRAVVVAAAGVAGPVWVAKRRRGYRRRGRALTAEERAGLAGHFARELLERARVAEVERIAPPLASVGAGWVLRALRLKGMLDVGQASGMTFGDVVVIVGRGEGGGVPRSLLFHELVHVEQYGRLGLAGFCRGYVRGWLETGSYFEIPLEREAYARQEGFERGAVGGCRAE